MINYLDYINAPTPENIKLVHQASGLTQKQAADMIGAQVDTIKGWHATTGATRHRTPQVAVWNLYLFELHARSVGNSSLLDLLKTHGATSKSKTFNQKGADKHDKYRTYPKTLV